MLFGFIVTRNENYLYSVHDRHKKTLWILLKILLKIYQIYRGSYTSGHFI